MIFVTMVPMAEKKRKTNYAHWQNTGVKLNLNNKHINPLPGGPVQ